MSKAATMQSANPIFSTRLLDSLHTETRNKKMANADADVQTITYTCSDIMLLNVLQLSVLSSEAPYSIHLVTWLHCGQLFMYKESLTSQPVFEVDDHTEKVKSDLSVINIRILSVI